MKKYLWLAIAFALSLLILGGCIYTSSLQPLTGTLSVTTRPI